MYEELGKLQLELEKIHAQITFLNQRAEPLIRKKMEILQELEKEEKKEEKK